MNTSKHTPRVPELVYDGKGINGPDEYRTRIATFTSDAYAKEYGHKLAAAPAMYEALQQSLVLVELAALEEWGRAVRGEQQPPTTEAKDRLEKVKAALAQAEGAGHE